MSNIEFIDYFGVKDIKTQKRHACIYSGVELGLHGNSRFRFLTIFHHPPPLYIFKRNV